MADPIGQTHPAWKRPSHHLTFSKAPAPLPTLPVFIMTIPNSKFQFLPPSSSQFATKLHPPAEGDEAIVGQGGCKNIYKAGWRGERAHRSPLITVILNVNACLPSVRMCVCAQHKDLSFFLRLVFDPAFSSTPTALARKKNKYVTLTLNLQIAILFLRVLRHEPRR